MRIRHSDYCGTAELYGIQPTPASHIDTKNAAYDALDELYQVQPAYASQIDPGSDDFCVSTALQHDLIASGCPNAAARLAVTLETAHHYPLEVLRQVPVSPATEMTVASWEASCYYFRVADSHTDILRERSAWLTEADGHTRERIARRAGYDCFRVLEAVLPHPRSTVFWTETGHRGPGLYFDGVCANATYLETLAYCEKTGMTRARAMARNLALFVIEAAQGLPLCECKHGVVIEPTEVIARMPLWLCLP